MNIERIISIIFFTWSLYNGYMTGRLLTEKEDIPIKAANILLSAITYFIFRIIYRSL